jgi:hypothetical protein
MNTIAIEKLVTVIIMIAIAYIFLWRIFHRVRLWQVTVYEYFANGTRKEIFRDEWKHHSDAVASGQSIIHYLINTTSKYNYTYEVLKE